MIRALQGGFPDSKPQPTSGFGRYNCPDLVLGCILGKSPSDHLGVSQVPKRPVKGLQDFRWADIIGHIFRKILFFFWGGVGHTLEKYRKIWDF